MMLSFNSFKLKPLIRHDYFKSFFYYNLTLIPLLTTKIYNFMSSLKISFNFISIGKE